MILKVLVHHLLNPLPMSLLLRSRNFTTRMRHQPPSFTRSERHLWPELAGLRLDSPNVRNGSPSPVGVARPDALAWPQSACLGRHLADSLLCRIVHSGSSSRAGLSQGISSCRPGRPEPEGGLGSTMLHNLPPRARAVPPVYPRSSSQPPLSLNHALPESPTTGLDIRRLIVELALPHAALKPA
jgi:hypothetical protein